MGSQQQIESLLPITSDSPVTCSIYKSGPREVVITGRPGAAPWWDKVSLEDDRALPVAAGTPGPTKSLPSLSNLTVT